MPLQIRRGSSATRTSITPAPGEPIWTTDTKVLYVGDGVTPGGIGLQTQLVSGSNIKTINGKNILGPGNIEVTDEIIITTTTNTLLSSGTAFVIALGEITITLPSAIGIPGKRYNVLNSGTQSITVLPQFGQTINGYINMTITETNSVMGLLSDGSNWRIF